MRNIRYKEENIKKLIDKVFFYQCVEKTRQDYRLYDSASYLYREIIEKHNGNNLINLLSQRRFKELVYATLTAFNMNQRAAKLVDFEKLSINFDSVKIELNELANKKIENLNSNELEKILSQIEYVFKKINIMQGKSQIVGISKTLHFLLPNLVMPIDRKYTMDFIYGTNKYYTNKDKEWIIFDNIFKHFYFISQKMKNNYKGSVPKLIDDAIIGYMKITTKL